MLKIASWITILSISGCGTVFPKPPPHVQYGVHANVEPPGFYGVHSETKERVYRDFWDPLMKGAQCVSAADYKQGQAYLKEAREIAEKRCR